MDQHDDMAVGPKDRRGHQQLARGEQRALARQVRLRTIIWIRWVAIAGQLGTLLIVQFGLGWSLPIDAALGAVVGSVLINGVMMFRRPSQGRVGELEAAVYLGCDILQLAVLLYLTGGLENPFALLFLGPVTVSATILSRSATAILSALVVVTATFLAFEHFPLPWPEPGLQLPVPYISGLWVAVVVGTLFMTVYIGSVAGEGRRMSEALTATQVALAREQQLSAVGGLAAAAAHELGSPLATIAVTVKELFREMPPGNPFLGDIEILQVEADRCRDILAEIGRLPETSDPNDPFATGLLSDVVAAAAARYRSEALALDVVAAPEGDSSEPIVPRSPEFLHGLGNVIQNAVQFGKTLVSVEVSWNSNEARVEVRDDGRGFPPGVLDRVGEPYISSRGDGHLGLGIFIAQTLLERTGARIKFSNIRDSGRVTGAEVVIIWQRDTLEVSEGKG